MDIKLSSKEAIFVQVVEAVKNNIANGILKPNDKLPSVRILANEMSVNPNTVSRAYLILESEGIIYSLNKKGYYVSDIKVDITSSIEISFKNNIKEMIKNNYTQEQLIQLIKGEYGHDKDK
ncbi:MAG: GntR family transcriptional regulator [bacterium]